MQSIVEMMSNQPESKVLYTLMFLLILDFKLSVILNPDRIATHFTSDAQNSRFSGSILGRQNIFSNLAGSTNLLIYLEGASLIVVILLVGLISTFFGWITYILFVPKNIKKITKNKVNSETRIGIQVYVVSACLHYFEYIFLIIFGFFMRIVICAVDKTTEQDGINDNKYIELGSNRHANNRLYIIDYNSCLLNKNIPCRSISHLYLIMFVSVWVVMAAYLRVMAHYLQITIPNPRFLMSKFGVIDNLHTLFIVGFMIYQSVLRTVQGEEYFTGLKYFYAIVSITMAIDVATQTISCPFYAPITNYLRLAESILFMLCGIFGFVTLVLPENSRPLVIFEQYPCMLALAALLFGCHRISVHIYKERAERLNSISFEDANNRRFLHFMHKAMRYIDESMNSTSDSIEGYEFQRILLDFFSLDKSRKKTQTMSRRRKLRDIDSKLVKISNDKTSYNKQSLGLKFDIDTLTDKRLSSYFQKESRIGITPVPLILNDVQIFIIKQMEEETNKLSSESSLGNHPQETPKNYSPTNQIKLPQTALKTQISKIRQENLISSTFIKDDSLPQSKDNDENDQQNPKFDPDQNYQISQNRDMSFGNMSQLSQVQADLLNKDNQFNDFSVQPSINHTSELSDQNKELIDVRYESMSSINQRGGSHRKLRKSAKASHYNADLAIEAKEIKRSSSFSSRASISNKAKKESRLKKKARYFILNTVNEENLKGARFPIELCNDMLDEHLARLMQNTAENFTKISDFLIVYVYFKINYLGAVYPVALKIRKIERKYQLEAKLKNAVNNSFLFKVIYSMIERHIAQNLDTGNLIFPKTRHLLAFQKMEVNSIKLYGCATFINVYNDLKRMIEKICGSKSEMLKSLLDHGIDFREMFRLAGMFTRYSQSLMKQFTNLIEQSKGRFTPLMMIYGNYLYHVEQNKMAARKVLKEFINKAFYYDMMSISGTTMDENEELVTIGVSAEVNTFHRITMLSCNCFNYLEYDALELIGQNLNCLLPSPLNSFHEMLMDPQFITGMLFEKKETQQLMFKKKNGFMSVCKAITRMNYKVNDQLDIFCALIFDKETLGLRNIMIIDEEMRITEISEMATDLFVKDTYIYQYNKKFARVFTDLNIVCNFRLKHDQLDLDSLMTDKSILKHYQTYFDFLNGEEMDVIDKSGDRRRLRVQINVTFMPTIQRYVRTMSYTLASLDDPKVFMDELEKNDQNMSDNGRALIRERREKNNIKFNYGLLDKNELELKRLLEYLQRTSILSISKGASWNVTQDRGVLGLNDIHFEEHSFLVGKGNFTPDAFTRHLNKAEPDKKNKIPENSPDFFVAYPQKSKSNKSAMDSSSEVYKSNESIQKAAQDRIALKKASSRNSVAETNNLQKGYRRDHIDQKFIRVIHDKINSLWYNCMFLLLIVLFLLSLLTQGFIGYQKYVTFDKLRNDMQKRIIAIDQSSWAIMGATSLAKYIDLTQAVKHDLLNDDAFSEHGIPSIVQKCRDLTGWMKGSIFGFSQRVGISMLSVAYSDIIDLNFYIYDPRFDTYFLSFSQSAISSNLFWFKGKWGGRKSISYIQPYIDWYISLPSSDLHLKHTDQMENYLTRVLSEGLLEYLVTDSNQVLHYFKTESQKSYNSILFTQLGAIFAMATIMISISICSGGMQLKMTTLYKMIFNFKVVCL